MSMGIEVTRMVRELRGEQFIPLELVKQQKKRIGCGRSFGKKVENTMGGKGPIHDVFDFVHWLKTKRK